MRLFIEQGESSGQEIPLALPTLTLGRGRENDVVLLDHGVSRQHARIHQTPRGWMLTDLGSTNGTWVNRQQLRAHEAYLLNPGDRVTMGAAAFVVREDAPAEPPTPQRKGRGPTEEERKKPHPALMAAAAVLLIVVVVGIVALLVVLLQPEEETIITPTPGNPVDEMMTVLPVPTQMQDLVTAIVPLIPTGLPFGLPGAATDTPPPPGTGP